MARRCPARSAGDRSTAPSAATRSASQSRTTRGPTSSQGRSPRSASRARWSAPTQVTRRRSRPRGSRCGCRQARRTSPTSRVRRRRLFTASSPRQIRRSHIWPGDTVHTTTVDAGGTDEKGVTRVLGGNPQTGPFYVETAMPGDVLVVHLNRVRLNRDWAISDDGIVGRALDPRFRGQDEGRLQGRALASRSPAWRRDARKSRRST